MCAANLLDHCLTGPLLQSHEDKLLRLKQACKNMNAKLISGCKNKSLNAHHQDAEDTIQQRVQGMEKRITELLSERAFAEQQLSEARVSMTVLQEHMSHGHDHSTPNNRNLSINLDKRPSLLGELEQSFCDELNTTLNDEKERAMRQELLVEVRAETDAEMAETRLESERNAAEADRMMQVIITCFLFHCHFFLQSTTNRDYIQLPGSAGDVAYGQVEAETEP